MHLHSTKKNATEQIRIPEEMNLSAFMYMDLRWVIPSVHYGKEWILELWWDLLAENRW